MEEILNAISSSILTRSYIIIKISNYLLISVPNKAIMYLLRFKYNKVLMNNPLI